MMRTNILFIFFFLWLGIMQNSVVQAQEAKQSEDIICASCQTANPAGSKFCGECGSALSNTQDRKFDVILLQSEDRQAMSTNAAQDSISAKALFEMAGHLVAKGEYEFAASYYRRIVETFPDSFYAKASLLMEKECRRLSSQNRPSDNEKKKGKNNNGSAFGGAFLGALIAPLAVLAILSAAY